MFKKIKYRIMKILINPFFYINHNLYTKFNLKILKKRGMKINGKPIFIANTVHFDGPERIEINDKVVISLDVLFLTHDFSISRGLECIGKLDKEISLYGNIIVEKNCFIGAKAIILPGTHIFEDCIIGAGSVVKGIIPPDSIVVGNPAKIIGKTSDWAKKKLESL